MDGQPSPHRENCAASLCLQAAHGRRRVRRAANGASRLVRRSSLRLLKDSVVGEERGDGRREPLSAAKRDESLRSAQRIGRSSEFQTIMSSGSRGVSPYLVAIWLAGGAGGIPSRLGVVASRKVGGAVQRSRAKRLLREVYRRTPNRPAGDLVLIARRGIHGASWNNLVRAYRTATRMALGRTRPRRRSSGEATGAQGQIRPQPRVRT